MESKDDNWGLILRKKEDLNKLLDRGIKEKIHEEKNSYKQDLDLQRKLLEANNARLKQEKKSEMNSILLQNKMLQNDELKKKLERLEIQSFLSNQYDLQSSLIKNKKQAEHQKQIEEERVKNQRVESEIVKENIFKQELKKRMFNDEQKMLSLKHMEKDQKEQEKQREKQRDTELYYKRTEDDRIREMKYKEFYKNLEQKQIGLQSIYAKQIIPKALDHEKGLNSWVEKNIEKKAKLNQYKDLYDQKVKQEAINNVKQVWNYQIEEKQRRLQELKEEQKIVHNSMQHQINESRKIDKIRENEKKVMQNIYKENLFNQANYRRNSASKFEALDIPSASTENDKKNASRFENVFHNYRSNSVTNSEYRRNQNSPSPLDHLHSRQGSNSGSDHYSIASKYSVHNPITNPIGSLSPKPIQRPLFRPHTLISY